MVDSPNLALTEARTLEQVGRENKGEDIFGLYQDYRTECSESQAEAQMYFL